MKTTFTSRNFNIDRISRNIRPLRGYFITLITKKKYKNLNTLNKSTWQSLWYTLRKKFPGKQYFELSTWNANKRKKTWWQKTSKMSPIIIASSQYRRHKWFSSRITATSKTFDSWYLQELWDSRKWSCNLGGLERLIFRRKRCKNLYH